MEENNNVMAAEIPPCEPPKIFRAISDTMADIGIVGKTSKNQQQGFMYRGIDAVMNALNPALIKHRIFVVPETLNQKREERQTAKGGLLIYSVVTVKYTFYAEDGSSVCAVVIGEGMDSGDKATNKAMSVAFKYALFQVFCIPTEELIDPDRESHEVKPKAPKEAPQQQPKAPEPKPPKTPVAKVDLKEVRAAAKKAGLDEAFLIELYNVPSMEVMTDKQKDHVLKNLDRLKDMQAKAKAEKEAGNE